MTKGGQVEDKERQHKRENRRPMQPLEKWGKREKVVTL